MILVDTSVWIEFFRGTPSAHRKKLHDLIVEQEGIALVPLILTEVLQGIKRDSDYWGVRETLLSFPIFISRGVETYIRAAEIYRTCRNRGVTPRSTVDCIIASIAIENGLVLFHHYKDFDLIEEHSELRCLKT